MASELDYNKLVQLVRKSPDIKQGEAATQLGLTIGQVSMLKFQQAKVEAGVLKKQPATARSVKDLRDKGNHRWEAIAAMTGLSPNAVKEKYEEAGGNLATSHTGRGRGGNGATTRSTTTNRKGAATSGRKKSTGGSASKKTTGSAKKSTGGRKVAVRRNVRGGRRSTAANPS